MKNAKQISNFTDQNTSGKIYGKNQISSSFESTSNRMKIIKILDQRLFVAKKKTKNQLKNHKSTILNYWGQCSKYFWNVRYFKHNATFLYPKCGR